MGDRLRIRLQAPAVEGKANVELQRFLAVVFGVRRSAITILRGEHARDKRPPIVATFPTDMVQSPVFASRVTLTQMDKIGLLTGILVKTEGVMEGVKEDMRQFPTPCPDYKVEDLVNHVVGWLQVFDADCNGRAHDGNAAEYHCQIHPTTEFHIAASSLLDGWINYGFDRNIRMMGSEMPAEMVFNMTAMEYLTHGWDLATATGQSIPYTEQEAEATLTRAVATLPAQYRGENVPFGNIVEVAGSAPAIDLLIGFMGRKTGVGCD